MTDHVFTDEQLLKCARWLAVAIKDDLGIDKDFTASLLNAIANRLEGMLIVTDDQMHFAISTFLAKYTGINGLQAMRETFEETIVFPRN